MSVCLRLVLLLYVLLALPAAVQARVTQPVCEAAQTAAEVDAAMAVDWKCNGEQIDRLADRVLLRFDLAPGAEAPRFLSTRAGQFSALTVTALDSNGTVLGDRRYQLSDAELSPLTPELGFPMPVATGEIRQVVVAVDRPWVDSLIVNAKLATHPSEVEWPLTTILIVAMIMGVLLVPLMFDIAFFRILRNRFLLWHCVVVMGMILQTAISTGLVVAVFPMPPEWLPFFYPMSLAISVAAAAMFAADFFEEDKISPRMKFLLRLTGGFILLFSTIYALKPPGTRSFAAEVYYACFIPVIAILAYAMAQAIWRGSRAAWFQLAAWMPLFLIGSIRILSNLVAGWTPTDTLIPFTIAIALEALITSLGVADRFVMIRQQRDRAEIRATIMASLSLKDPLTDLANRRAIETDFASLRGSGYNVFAVLDIDRFKAINDNFGHQRGDDVLRAVGLALARTEDMIAYRLGGEEFIILLRGENGVQLAEARRQAISAFVARHVVGLDRVITASMGVVEMPLASQQSFTFDNAYEIADRLLYEAKSSGRNRMVVQSHTPSASPPRGNVAPVILPSAV